MRNNLSSVHVYVTAVHKVALEKAADLDSRSLSNYLLNLGLLRAVELGVMVPGFRPNCEPLEGPVETTDALPAPPSPFLRKGPRTLDTWPFGV